MTRHLLIKSLLMGAVFALLPSLPLTAYGDVPSMDVTVFNSAGKVAFKGPIGSSATFATRNLAPGDYVVQFNTRSAAVKDNQYVLVVSAGKKKVIATGVAGEKFTRGGVAMRIPVGPDSHIIGQVAKEEATARGEGLKYRVIDGKRFVWVTASLGSHLGGHWESELLAPAGNVAVWRSEDLQKQMNRGGEGSMIENEDHNKGY
jgi:hypothetical protein